jgi:ribosomal protein L37AE/L43A
MKKESIKKTLSEMEPSFTGSDMEDKSSEKISQMAEKGRTFIDRVEDKANEVAAKIREKHKCHDCDEKQKKEKIKKCFVTALVAFIAVMSLKKISLKSIQIY